MVGIPNVTTATTNLRREHKRRRQGNWRRPCATAIRASAKDLVGSFSMRAAYSWKRGCPKGSKGGQRMSMGGNTAQTEGPLRCGRVGRSPHCLALPRGITKLCSRLCSSPSRRAASIRKNATPTVMLLDTADSVWGCDHDAHGARCAC